jgi:hypothetical protein
MQRVADLLAIGCMVVAVLIAIPLLILSLPFLLIGRAYDYMRGKQLVARFREDFARHGVVGILVYSNSPNWQEHIETEVLPTLARNVLIVNWSQRSTWRRSAPLPVKIFLHLKPQEHFNPLGIVLTARGSFELVQLHEAYLAKKHGKDQPLARQLAELRALVTDAVRHWSPKTA